jgi:hypothetical protein
MCVLTWARVWTGFAFQGEATQKTYVTNFEIIHPETTLHFCVYASKGSVRPNVVVGTKNRKVTKKKSHAIDSTSRSFVPCEEIAANVACKNSRGTGASGGRRLTMSVCFAPLLSSFSRSRNYERIPSGLYFASCIAYSKRVKK